MTMTSNLDVESKSSVFIRFHTDCNEVLIGSRRTTSGLLKQTSTELHRQTPGVVARRCRQALSPGVVTRQWQLSTWFTHYRSCHSQSLDHKHYDITTKNDTKYLNNCVRELLTYAQTRPHETKAWFWSVLRHLTRNQMRHILPLRGHMCYSRQWSPRLHVHCIIVQCVNQWST